MSQRKVLYVWYLPLEWAGFFFCVLTKVGNSADLGRTRDIMNLVVSSSGNLCKRGRELTSARAADDKKARLSMTGRATGTIKRDFLSDPKTSVILMNGKPPTCKEHEPPCSS